MTTKTASSCSLHGQGSLPDRNHKHARYPPALVAGILKALKRQLKVDGDEFDMHSFDAGMWLRLTSFEKQKIGLLKIWMATGTTLMGVGLTQ